jgi:hypothetical protein
MDVSFMLQLLYLREGGFDTLWTGGSVIPIDNLNMVAATK